MRASDIHIEPREHVIALRYRVVGHLQEIRRFEPRSLIQPIASRIKVMGGMDISEKRLPQDGRIHVRDHIPEAKDFDSRPPWMLDDDDEDEDLLAA